MNDFDNKQICSYKDIDRFGFTCDVCGRKVNGCSIVNGMKFCAKCYQETFGKDNQQNEIQQLKQQLEEKDKLLKCYQEEEKLIADILGDKDLTIIGSRVHLKNLIVELKNKIKDRDIVIEEKDKEIEKLKQELEETNAGYDFTYEQSTETIKELKQNQTQLAIKELEKVNGILTDTIIEATQNEMDLNKLCYLEEISARFYEKMQEQIKELKGGQT